MRICEYLGRYDFKDYRSSPHMIEIDQDSRDYYLLKIQMTWGGASNI